MPYKGMTPTEKEQIEYKMQIVYNAISVTFTTWLYFSAEKIRFNNSWLLKI